MTKTEMLMNRLAGAGRMKYGGRVMEELREPKEVEREQDIEFLTHILFEVRDYARSAGQEPDETLKSIAEWILALLEIATFNGAEGE